MKIEKSDIYKLYSFHIRGKCYSFRDEEDYTPFMQNIDEDKITKIIYLSEKDGSVLNLTHAEFEKLERSLKIRRGSFLENVSIENSRPQAQ